MCVAETPANVLLISNPCGPSFCIQVACLSYTACSSNFAMCISSSSSSIVAGIHSIVYALQSVPADKECLCGHTALSGGRCEVVSAVPGAHHVGLCWGLLHPLQRRSTAVPGHLLSPRCCIADCISSSIGLACTSSSEKTSSSCRSPPLSQMLHC